jgi:hypothetical protein
MTSSAAAIERLPKGRGWEYRTHRAAYLSGWFVRRGVNLRERVNGSPQTMAEVDILGMSFDAGLREHRLVGECKDRKGSAKEADRIVWLLGLREVLDATDVLFAKPNLSDAIYTWAKPLNISLWDEAAVRKVESSFGLPENDGFVGSFNVDLCEGSLATLRNKATDPHVKRAWDYLSGAFWYSPNVARTKRLPAYFQTIMRADLSDDARDAYIAEGLVALLTCAMNTARDLRRLSPARATAELNNAFSSGAADAPTLRGIASRADSYYRDAILKATEADDRARLALQMPRLADSVAEPPAWLAEYLAFVEGIGRRVDSATEILRFADILLYEILLADNPLPPPRVMESFITPAEELSRAVRTAAYFTARVWGVECPLMRRLVQGGRIAASPGGTVSTDLSTSSPLQAQVDGKPVEQPE